MIAALSNYGTVLKLLLKTNSSDVNLTDNEGVRCYISEHIL